jgi:hypothetical protein
MPNESTDQLLFGKRFVRRDIRGTNALSFIHTSNRLAASVTVSWSGTLSAFKPLVYSSKLAERLSKGLTVCSRGSSSASLSSRGVL